MDNNLDMSGMLNAIIQATKPSPSSLTGFGWGVVQTIDPVTIKISNNMIIPSTLIELSPFCKEWKTKRFEHLHKYTETEETEKSLNEFVFWRGLQVGDSVCYLRTNDSQKFILLWRKQDLD